MNITITKYLHREKTITFHDKEELFLSGQKAFEIYFVNVPETCHRVLYIHLVHKKAKALIKRGAINNHKRIIKRASLVK